MLELLNHYDCVTNNLFREKFMLNYNQVLKLMSNAMGGGEYVFESKEKVLLISLVTTIRIICEYTAVMKSKLDIVLTKEELEENILILTKKARFFYELRTIDFMENEIESLFKIKLIYNN